MSLAQNRPTINRSETILPAKFDNPTVTNRASLAYIEAFKQKIGFQQLLETGLSFSKRHNAQFGTANIIDFMVDAAVLGLSRFNHMEDLRHDNVYLKLKGRAPSEKVCRDLLRDLPESTASEIRLINKRLLEKKARSEGPRSVALNIDDTVCTVFGDQEGSGVGYNPTKHGRASFKEKVGILGLTNEVINLTLENGRHHTNYELEAFIRKCRILLPDAWILKRVRIDCGGFDIDNLSYLDEQDLEFTIKCKKYKSLQVLIDSVNHKDHLYPWTDVDETFSVNECHFRLPKWQKCYRFILVRKPAPVKDKKQQQMDLDAVKYCYQLIVTNIETMTAAEIFHDYNQRCDVENKIDELKEGFAFDQNSQRNLKCNQLFLLIKMLAYNLHNWFKQAILPESWRSFEIMTVRRRFYHLAANICGNGRYRHLRYARDWNIEWLIRAVIDRLQQFSLMPV
jgi:hypothetical protein